MSDDTSTSQYQEYSPSVNYEAIYLATLAFISGNASIAGNKHHPVCTGAPVYPILI
ncbi:hypothetical protein [Escherichia coli]|uniref:hypothetical protein n=1 Tax=Escherichia coli TaxID=562 RepID=UPI00131A0C47|nr:hypothetical protein [Escherichia coli]